MPGAESFSSAARCRQRAACSLVSAVSAGRVKPLSAMTAKASAAQAGREVCSYGATA